MREVESQLKEERREAKSPTIQLPAEGVTSLTVYSR